jgi:hypothetical protein
MKFIEKEDDIVIRIPRKLYSKNVQHLIDVIQFKKSVANSKATQKDIDDIMTDIKKDRKKLMKPLLEKIEKISK